MVLLIGLCLKMEFKNRIRLKDLYWDNLVVKPANHQWLLRKFRKFKKSSEFDRQNGKIRLVLIWEEDLIRNIWMNFWVKIYQKLIILEIIYPIELRLKLIY